MPWFSSQGTPHRPWPGLDCDLPAAAAPPLDRVVAAGPRRPHRARCHRGGDAARCPHPPPLGPPAGASYVGRFTDGVEVLTDGTVLHLASIRLADAELRLDGSDDPAFASLKAKYADVLGGAPPGLPSGETAVRR